MTTKRHLIIPAYETRENAEKNLSEWTQQERVVLRLVVNTVVKV